MSDDHRLPTPRVAELDPALTPFEAFQRLADLPGVVFFDSAAPGGATSRWSYIAADPVDWIEVPADGRPALAELQRRLAPWRAARVEGLPPWQGGAAGVIGYEVGRSLERLPRPRWDEFAAPALAMGLYDVVVAFDHAKGRCWGVSQGLPERGFERDRRAALRLEAVLRRLEGDPRERTPRKVEAPLAREQLAPSFETPGRAGVLSDFSREGYLDAVRWVVDRLRAGDAYQVNLSQRLMVPDPGDPVALYLRLRERNPAPMAGYFDGGDWQVLSASPERFLGVEEGRVETRPIKGTRPRGAGDDEDARVAAELRASVKDRAENVMIVDLLRNDLSRVCEDASVRVEQLTQVERFAHVQHLVSVVSGTLRPECCVADLLAATLPGGSVTGAPKARVQELIAAVEPTARGAYCGALAWVGLAGASGRQAMDSSVLIRTLTRSRGWIQAPVGGGVTVLSDPLREYEETWHKAVGLIEPILCGERGAP